MIYLKDDKEYFILIDGQGGTFGGGRIFEGKAEAFEQFASWADSDDSNIDGEFIDLLDTLMGFEFGLTTTEWIEHQYKTGKRGVREVFEDLSEKIID